MSNDIVITPGGPRLRSKVHLIKPNSTVAVSTQISTRLTKNGVSGRPDSANWITAAWLDTVGGSVMSFSTTWKVPPAPATQTSQLLYLFSGMQPNDASTIVQPVLQWGGTEADEDGKTRVGQFWTVASWIVPAPDGHVHHTPHVRVKPGDTLVGTIGLTNKSAAGCTYFCEFSGLAGTKFGTPPISELVWCVETLEAYELGSSAKPPYDLNNDFEYPAANSTIFGSINILANGKPQNASWTVTDYVSDFGEHTEVAADSSTNGQVVIYYSGKGGAAGQV